MLGYIPIQVVVEPWFGIHGPFLKVEMLKLLACILDLVEILVGKSTKAKSGNQTEAGKVLLDTQNACRFKVMSCVVSYGWAESNNIISQQLARVFMLGFG